MSLRLAALFVAAATSLSASFAQDKSDPPKKVQVEDRKAQLDALIQDFVKARQEANREMRTAKTDQERKLAEAKLPKEADFLPRVHLLIAKGAKDDVAGEALAFAVFGLDTKDRKSVV